MSKEFSLSDTALLATKFINYTSKNIFLTGKAGTGKTTFLKYIIQHTYKKAIIAAPTGIAAINAGGVTIHSLFQLPFGSFVPFNQGNANLNKGFKVNDPLSLTRNLFLSDKKRQLIKELELLIIDEVSMLRADLLDAIDTVLRHIRRKNSAFGGLQVLFIGDLLQLPPVVKDEEWEQLKQFYKSAYFFDARVLQNEKPVYIELEKIYRQGDEQFIALLNNLRNNQINNNDIELLNGYYKPGFKPKPQENYITLTTHNYKALNLNKTMLQELGGKSFFYEAIIHDDFNEFAYPVEQRIELKVGAQIMFIKNDPSGNQRFFNGKIGKVLSLTDKSIEVKFDDNTAPITVEKYVWENVKYALDEVSNEIEEQVIGTFTQYPIKLAWAITVHKSQGLTFDKAIIDIGSAFATGQVYVALSRLRSLDGLVLTSKINYNNIGQDDIVTEFSKIKAEQENPGETVKKESLSFLKNYLILNFDLNPIFLKLEEHCNNYKKDEKKSVKQKYLPWALELKANLNEIRPASEKFMNFLDRVMEARETGYFEVITKRVNDARNYFTPQIKELSNVVFKHIENVKSEKKIKSYIEELLAIELIFHEQLKKMNKAYSLCQSISENTLLTKDILNKLINDQGRIEKIQQLLKSPEKEKKEIVKKAKETKPRHVEADEFEGPENVDNTNSLEKSIALLRTGKTLEQVADIRGFAVTTIEGHLAKAISLGKLQAHYFVSNEKVKVIIEAAKKLGTLNLKPIKELLGDEFTYRDIKLAMAAHLALVPEKN